MATSWDDLIAERDALRAKLAGTEAARKWALRSAELQSQDALQAKKDLAEAGATLASTRDLLDALITEADQIAACLLRVQAIVDGPRARPLFSYNQLRLKMVGDR